MNTLYLTVGLPRSGKTTWCRKNLSIGPVINPDSFRLEVHGQRFFLRGESLVWWTVEVAIRSLFRAGHKNIVLDATNITRKRRDRWQSLDWRRKFVVFDTSKEECIRRAGAGNDYEIFHVIEDMAAIYEPVSPEEGEILIG